MVAPSTSSALPLLAAAIPVQIAGMGFNFLPPLPISMPFKFLKSVYLKTIGKGLGDVPSRFVWKLVEWKPTVEQSESKGGLGPNEVFTDVFEVLEVVDDVSEEGSVPENILGLGDFETGPEPIPNFSEIRIESPLVFEDKLDDPFDKVADINVNEEPETPHETIQSTPVDKPQTGEGLRRKRIKTPAGRIDLPPVCEFLTIQLKSSSPSSQQKSAPPKPTLKPTRKSFRLAS